MVREYVSAPVRFVALAVGQVVRGQVVVTRFDAPARRRFARGKRTRSIYDRFRESPFPPRILYSWDGAEGGGKRAPG